jgi:hypothetical protein
LTSEALERWCVARMTELGDAFSLPAETDQLRVVWKVIRDDYVGSQW